MLAASLLLFSTIVKIISHYTATSLDRPSEILLDSVSILR
jgi:hypothetical protein